MSGPYTIWCNAELSQAAERLLASQLGGHQLVRAERPTESLFPGSPDPKLAEAEIVWGQPDPSQLMQSTQLRWVEVTSAGFTRYDKPEFWERIHSQGVAFTNCSSVFDEPCAQHLLAFMLAHARQLPEAFVAQMSAREWRYSSIRPKTRLLSGDTVLLLGFGAIARRLVELLAPFDLGVFAVRRRRRGDEPVPTYSEEQFDQMVNQADHLVITLPASDSTREFLSARRISKMKPGAIIYNVGRGATINHSALLEALKSGHLGAAYLDVTDPEPLPPEHPLWTAPNCVITPHVAGGHFNETERLVEHFLANLRRFEAGELLTDLRSGLPG